MAAGGDSDECGGGSYFCDWLHIVLVVGVCGLVLMLVVITTCVY